MDAKRVPNIAPHNAQKHNPSSITGKIISVIGRFVNRLFTFSPIQIYLNLLS